MGVAPRSFNQINAFACTGTVVKSSENIEAIEAEKNWYRQLPEQLRFIHPRIYDLESPGSIRMEYLDYPTAHEMYIANRTGVLVWTNIFQTTKAISYVLSQDSIPISKEESYRMIDADMKHLDFPYGKAEGFNTISVEHRAKFEYMTMRDYLRYLWNQPYAGQSPYTMFGG